METVSPQKTWSAKNAKNPKGFIEYLGIFNTFKVFEKLILKRIMEIRKESGVDITGVEQHGFKNSKSTASAGLIIQSILWGY